MRMLLGFTLAALCANGFAQSAPSPAASGAAAFPATSAPLTAGELKTRLSGKQFLIKPRDGNEVRLDFKSNGYLFVNMGTGFNGSGPWRTEDGQLCTDGRIGATCMEARAEGERLFFKRPSGEIVEYLPR